MLFDTEKRLMEILKEQVEDIDESEVTMDSKLTDIGINSLSFIKIAVAIEKEFNMQFEVENLSVENFETLKNILEYIEKK